MYALVSLVVGVRGTLIGNERFVLVYLIRVTFSQWVVHAFLTGCTDRVCLDSKWHFFLHKVTFMPWTFPFGRCQEAHTAASGSQDWESSSWLSTPMPMSVKVPLILILRNWAEPRKLHFYQVFLALPTFAHQVIQNSFVWELLILASFPPLCSLCWWFGAVLWGPSSSGALVSP